ncbi:NAD(P)-dependent oxidoreductase [Dyadobacter crusticola]|uniref:NAD(P)-dependent oxidoreductase n=1 Tax=Dyadobacter crusticola TaxID=292407 RepID=UPI0004E1795D|nr:NAD(P)H-binding protein [Dyadobacter crusticola]
MKNIAVIGATGSAGKEVVRLALSLNYNVTVVVRNPARIHPEMNLTIVKGDVMDIESLKEAFMNIDVVISCFGPSNGRKPGNIMSVGTSNIVRACEKGGVAHFIFMSGILQTDGSELTWLNRLGIQIIRSFFREVYMDKITGEASIQTSSLDWTIVRAVGLTKSRPTGKYKAGVSIRVSPFKPMSFEDMALCLLDAVENAAWTRKIINVGKA